MPCDTIRQVTVELKVADKQILLLGLLASGFTTRALSEDRLTFSKGLATGVIDLKAGRITIQEGNEKVINEIKRSYSSEVIRQSAKRFGWNLNQTEENRYVAKRRF